MIFQPQGAEKSKRSITKNKKRTPSESFFIFDYFKKLLMSAFVYELASAGATTLSTLS